MTKSQEEGKELENYVENVYSLLLQNEHLKKFQIKKNHIEIAKSGAKHEFDVYYEVKIAGITHKVAIECKNYNRRVEKEKLDAFSKKLDGCNIKTGFMISKNGYQEGAKQEAKYYGIELITTEDLPNIYSLSLTHMKWILPDEKTYGDPFWTIMEVTENEKNTGMFLFIEDRIPLFISKKSAERVLKKIGIQGFAVFGVTREHLIGICHMAAEYNWPFAIAAKFGFGGPDNQFLMFEHSYDEILDHFDTNNL